jgi:hypothetical protein
MLSSIIDQVTLVAESLDDLGATWRVEKDNIYDVDRFRFNIFTM